MKAWQLNNPPQSSSLFLADVPEPRPETGEVLIRVHAVGVTPTELSWYPTLHTPSGAPRTGAIPGHEFCGTVVAIGSNAADIAPGQHVYGMNDWFAQGATAEFCLSKPEWIAPKPARLTDAEAASVPISALTAWQGLFDRAKLQKGERVLIHGGSGGVGVFAVQLAKHHGAHILTTASARHTDFLRQLGADQVIDYHAARFEDVAKEMDVVFDAVGGDTLNRSWSVLNSRGRLVTIASGGSEASDEKTKKAFFIVEPQRDQLAKIADLLDSGAIYPVVDAIVPFAQVPAAYAGQFQPRQNRGKGVVTVAE